MATQNQRRSLSEAWPIVEYPDKLRNIHITRPEYQTALNIPVSRQTPPLELQQFSVQDNNVWIHVWDLFVRDSDDQRVLMRFSEDARHRIEETMCRMFVPSIYPQEDALPADILVPLIPYQDESGEKVTVITTLLFNSLPELQTVLVAPVDPDGRVDVARTRACHKDVLTPVEGPEVQKRDAVRDIHGFFLQGISPTDVTFPLPKLHMRQERQPYDDRYEVLRTVSDILDNKDVDDGTLVKKLRDLSTTSRDPGGGEAPIGNVPLLNTSRTDDVDAMLEHEGHLSQQGQRCDTVSRPTGDGCIHPDQPVPSRAVENDLSAIGVLRHFKKTASTFGTHVGMCPLCQTKAGRLFHAAICRETNCERCNSVAEGVARHMGRCVDPSCPIYGSICANGISIPLFVYGRWEPTAVFVSIVRSVLARRILRFDA